MSKVCHGFVKDNKDPLKLGRCKVNIIGLYDSLKDEELPWLQPIIPLNTQNAPTPPEIGTQIVCLVLDDYNQHIVMLGVIPGIDDISNLPDTPDIIRNDSTPSIVSAKSTSRDPDFEPNATSTYGALYPYNKGFLTPGGHAFEYDDTSGKERIQLYHKSGSYVEIVSDGSVIIKSINNKYEITDGQAGNKISGEYFIKSPIVNIDGILKVSSGASGTFSASGKVVTVSNGIVTSIYP